MVATKTKSFDLDSIPAKKYLTIGEVSRFTGIKDHVLRYWEQHFVQLTPSKRSGRRYYQRDDVLLIIEISHLLNDEGLTIAGAQNRLAKQPKNGLSAEAPAQQSQQTDGALAPLVLAVKCDIAQLQQARQIAEVLQQQIHAFQKHLEENY
ncbi:transcriptional regulator [Thiosulfatimonas sediminis]|uniref:Transcriptional regulator n=1 Tax=Thiosulfatimonas sediminis TaxID=2675054 RepID=A0A6F8PWE6_9GAMM|nr:MerR family transcriptional regulator [Thiosulfatimonas sediminis]BBP46439.1 transcriptional regulator [Thiosulfatimonas sediminis]